MIENQHDKTHTAKAALPSLWTRLGGTPGVQKIVNDFVDLAIVDAEVNYSRDGQYDLDERSIAKAKHGAFEFISSAAGGPVGYDGRSLVDIHRGMAIRDSEFDAIAADFRAALTSNGVDRATVALVMAMVEATRAMIVEGPS
jgi:hemoglobin